MLLAVLLILDAGLLCALGWGIRKDQSEAERAFREWAVTPIPMKVTRAAVWRSEVKNALYKKIDSHVNPHGYTPKHGYVHP